MTAVPLAITMGDPAGVGPEIIAKAAAELRPRLESGALRMVVIGSNAALENARSRFTPDIAIPAVTEDDPDWPALCALQAGPEGEPIRPGQLSADGGRFAFQAVERGVRLAMAGPHRRHRHRAAEQGGAEQSRLPLPRPYRDAG